jgi:hypothetical protein
VLSTLHARLRVQRAPGIPHALLGEGILHNSGVSCRENADLCLAVIASGAKQSSKRQRIIDCFVASLLAAIRRC